MCKFMDIYIRLSKYIWISLIRYSNYIKCTPKIRQFLISLVIWEEMRIIEQQSLSQLTTCRPLLPPQKWAHWYKGSRQSPPRKIPPGKFHPGIFPQGMFPPEKTVLFWFLAALFRFVARFARVRIEDSSFNRFASTAYFEKPGFVGREHSGGK